MAVSKLPPRNLKNEIFVLLGYCTAELGKWCLMSQDISLDIYSWRWDHNADSKLCTSTAQRQDTIFRNRDINCTAV